MLLMEKQDYDKITITDITRRAGVSRMTYYRLYQSKDDIIDSHLTEIFDDMMDQIHSKQIITEREFFICFFNAVNENRLLFQNVVKARMLEMVWRKEKEYTVPLFNTFFQPRDDDPLAHYRLCFFAGGFLQISREWIESGMQEDVETLAELACSITEKLHRLSSQELSVTNVR